LGADDWVLESALLGRGAEGQRITALIANDPDTDNRSTILLWGGEPFGWLSKQHSLYLIPRRELPPCEDLKDLQAVCDHIENLVRGRGEQVGISPLSTIQPLMRIAEHPAGTP
jgi:hypothetical protein